MTGPPCCDGISSGAIAHPTLSMAVQKSASFSR